MSVLAKYDVRGIQSYVFRTEKLKEIRAVQDLPEKIIFQAMLAAAGLDVASGTEEELAAKGILVLDKAGGNAIVQFDSKECYQEISRKMARYIFEETYSLKLCYACVECSDDFMADYNALNQKLGALKSSMPEVTHMGAFPICMQDYRTGMPIAAKKKLPDRKYEFLTQESVLKRIHRKQASNDQFLIDDLIQEKGVDSKIAVIHIDGNNIGNRINQILSKASYANVKEVFASIQVRDEFHAVCEEMEQVVTEYQARKKAEFEKAGKQYDETKPLIYAIIQAGDDITYITQADIALSFTKLFLQHVSGKYMLKESKDKQYLISACAGIAFCHSHFPFIDAYELAENLCANAKSRAKEKQNRGEDGYIGNWLDFEICGHIRDVDVNESRKRYAKIGGKELLLRPYCISHPNCPAKAPFDFDAFEKNLKALTRKKKTLLNRSRAKALRQAYTDGENAVTFFHAEAVSRGYFEDEKFADVSALYSGKYAVLYDAVEIMDEYESLEEVEA